MRVACTAGLLFPCARSRQPPRRLLGLPAATRKLNFPGQAEQYAAAAAAAVSAPAQPALPSLPEEDEPVPPPHPLASHAAPDEEEEEDLDEMLSTAAAAMRAHLTTASPAPAPPAVRPQAGWAPLSRLPGALSLRDVVENSAPAEAPTDRDPAQLLHPPRDARKAARAAARAGGAATAGAGWFGLGAPTMTEELKRDLRVLRLRGVTDPKRFYKRADSGKLPTHFAMGTVVESAADFHSSRMAASERRQTLAEEVLADQAGGSYRKSKFAELQGPPRHAKKRKGGAGGPPKKGRGGPPGLGGNKKARHAPRRANV